MAPDSDSPVGILIEATPAHVLVVRCHACNAVVGEIGATPGAFGIYHCRATSCRRWTTLIIPPLPVLERIVDDARAARGA